MNFARYEYVKASMEVFSFAALQEFSSISRALYEYDIEPAELIEYIVENKKIFAGESAKKSVGLKAATQYCFCPKCGGGIIIESVNDSPRNQIDPLYNDGEVYASLASCVDLLQCGWQKFSTLPQYALMTSFFPKSVQDGLVELTLTPHGHNDLLT